MKSEAEIKRYFRELFPTESDEFIDVVSQALLKERGVV